MKIRENHEEVNHTLVNNQDRGGSVRAKGDAGDSLGSTSPRLLREVSMQEGVNGVPMEKAEGGASTASQTLGESPSHLSYLH